MSSASHLSKSASPWRRLLLGLLRVPPEPDPPPGTPATMTAFRASRRYLYYLLLGWALGQLGTLLGILFGLVVVDLLDEDPLPVELGFLRFLEIAALCLFAVQLVASYALVRLGWELRWYLVSDTSVRIREGLFRVWEQTLTVANIQNLKVTQGPLQKLFGIADLEIHTAGGGSKAEPQRRERGKRNLHVGRLRGLEDAVELRDRLRAALGRLRDSGLGDPDDRVPGPVAVSGSTPLEATPEALLHAARVLAEEARALRAVLSEPRRT